jgi:DNA-binding NtrC family response regulator
VLSLESFREKIGPEAAAAFGGGGTGEGTVDADAGSAGGGAASAQGGICFGDTLPTLPDIERLLIEEALRRADGNQTTAARLLGLSRRALNNRLRRAAEDDEE